MAAIPTTGAFGLLTALAPTPVLPNGTAESGGGVGVGAAGVATARESSVTSGSTAPGHRIAALSPCTR